jgi:hypothetical protein
LSSHPNPGNRYERINQEAALLRVNPNNAIQDTRAFENVQAQLRGRPRARSSDEIARNGQRYPTQNYPQDDSYARGGGVDYPSASYRSESNNLFRASIPSNWRSLGSDGSAVSYAPEGAYGSAGITHGVMFATDREQYSNLDQASQQLVQNLLQAQGNNYLRQSSGWRRAIIDGRDARSTTLSGRSPITGQTETVTLVTTMLSSGDLFYMAAVVPSREYRNYQRPFDEILRSLRLNDRY